jgi:hypothetical protein
VPEVWIMLAFPSVSLPEAQFDLLRKLAALDPPACVMGGYAEDALLAGTVTRPHGDIDPLLPRRELELRLAQFAELGFGDFSTWGEAAPGQPFYLYGQNAGNPELKLELGIADEEDGKLWIKVHKLMFDLDGEEPAVGYRVELPTDTFDHPPIEIDGLRIKVASPLCLYQLRAGIASKGSFGELSDRQQESMRQLRQEFFSDRSDAELQPRVEPLA